MLAQPHGLEAKLLGQDGLLPEVIQQIRSVVASPADAATVVNAANFIVRPLRSES